MTFDPASAIEKPAAQYTLGGRSIFNAQVTFAGIPGRTYSIQRSDSLVTPDWATIGSAPANALGQINFTDTSPPGGQAFYRTTFP